MSDKIKDITDKEIVNKVFDKNESLSPQGLQQMIKLYARKRLAEQREICAKQVREDFMVDEDGEEWLSYSADPDRIENAPEPDL